MSAPGRNRALRVAGLALAWSLHAVAAFAYLVFAGLTIPTPDLWLVRALYVVFLLAALVRRRDVRWVAGTAVGALVTLVVLATIGDHWWGWGA